MTNDTLSLDALETPALIVDLDRLENNLRRVAAYATQHGLALRPHVKTHKSPRVAAQQLELGAVGLTCATPYEAEVMSAVTNDLLVAYPPVGALRATRLADGTSRSNRRLSAAAFPRAAGRQPIFSAWNWTLRIRFRAQVAGSRLCLRTFSLFR